MGQASSVITTVEPVPLLAVHVQLTLPGLNEAQ
jgi:hypothetical protein